MSNIYDTPLFHIINKRLDASNSSNDMSLMLGANDIETYSTFKTLNTEDMYAFERVTTKGTTIKLRSHHAKCVLNICKYISYLGLSSRVTIADDPIPWDTGDFNLWKHQGKPSFTVVPTGNAPPLVATGAATATSTATATATSAADK